MSNKTEKNSNEKTILQKIINKLGKSSINYFDLFIDGAAISLEAAKSLKAAMEDEEIKQDEIKYIKEIEHKGDKHVHEAQRIIEAAFITPIDQSDIMEILKGIESVTDSIDDVANHIYIMKFTKVDQCMSRFLDIMVSSCEKMYELMVALRNFQKKPGKDINRLIIEINALEEDGDKVYSECMRNIFTTETDPINIIKKKEIYQLLEHTLDCVEDVADVIEKLMIAKT
ncbi:MAG TPA: DUF47 family protein [Clostridiaceae bacterium]|nr:DUF47 family protein [Clostridiaceae bacterium]